METIRGIDDHRLSDIIEAVAEYLNVASPDIRDPLGELAYWRLAKAVNIAGVNYGQGNRFNTDAEIDERIALLTRPRK